MKHTGYHSGVVLSGVLTCIHLSPGLGSKRVVVCGPDPGYYLIRDLEQALVTAMLGVIHLWLVYCWAIRTHRSEEAFGVMRTMVVLPLSLVAMAGVVRYLVMIVVACR